MSVNPLFQEFTMGPITLKNRIVMAPLTRGRAGEERLANQLMADYYVQRASAGLLISEATTISESANGWNHSPGIYMDQMIESWAGVVSQIHNAGSRIFCQLWHMGRASHSDFLGGRLPVAPSAMGISDGQTRTPYGKKDYEVPRALETNEIPLIVEDYRKAAENAMKAGFDGVEIHSANGYLIDTFLQSKTNHRTDAYGGSVENRYRLLHEVAQATISVCGPNRVGVRLSPNGVFNDMGSPDFRDQFTFVASQLDALGLAYLHVMDGLAFGFHNFGDPLTLKDFRKVFHGPLMGNCGYTKESAEHAIASGDADLIAFGRPYISNPDLAERFLNHWPLAPNASMDTWYEPTAAAGYTDFPKYQ